MDDEYDYDEMEKGEGTGDEGTDISDEEDGEEMTVMQSAESTMVKSLPCAQPRLTDMSVARVKLQEQENIREMERQVEAQGLEKDRDGKD